MTIKIETVTIEMDAIVWERICELTKQVKEAAADVPKLIAEDTAHNEWATSDDENLRYVGRGPLFDFWTDTTELHNWLQRAKVIDRGER